MKPKNNRHIHRWRLLAFGAVLGILLATIIASGYRISGSPSFCSACHSMEHVAQHWQQSNHKQFACIECHMPDSNLIAQAAYKTRAGLNDLFHETFQTYPAAIQLSGEGRAIARGNCLRCHYSTIENTPMARQGGDCLKCHRNLVHGRGLEKGGMKIE